ncbi:MAG: glycosyltransferase family 9 protein [Candidatus Omnitrophota bacterium]
MKGIGIADIWRSEGSFRLKAVKCVDHAAGWLLACSLPRRDGGDVNFPQGLLRVLIIRPGGMGDAVFLLPIIRELKRLGHTVDVLCERRNRHVFNSQEALCGKIFCYDIGPDFLAVFRQEYDVVVDTEQWHYLSAITAYFIKAHYRIGFATRPARTKLFNRALPYDHADYELKSFVRLFESFGISAPLQLKGSYAVSAADMTWVRGIIKLPYIVLALGGSIALRRFSKEQAVAICRGIMGKGYSVVLLGGTDVSGLAQAVIAGIQDQRVQDVTGKITLSQSAALIAEARQFIGHDSGLLHMAGALGVPSVAVFGPGNKDKWGPKGSQDVVICQELPCSPCTWFGYTLLTCQRKAMCIHGPDYRGCDEIVAAICESVK